MKSEKKAFDVASEESLPKLLVITSTLPRFADDPEPRFVLSLAQELSSRYRITLLAPMDPRSRQHDTLNGISVVRYRYTPMRSWETLAYPGGIMPRLRNQPWRWLQVPMLLLGLFRAIRRLQHSEDFNCIHCHWLVPQGIMAVLALPKGNPPVVVTSHGGDLYTLNRGPTRALLRHVLNRAAAVTVVSEHLAQVAEELNVKESKTKRLCRPTVIPMGVDVNAFKPEQRLESWPTDIGLTRPLILFVGRLAEKKGLAYLLEAMTTPELIQLGAKLAIVGDGPLRSTLQTQATALGLNSRVNFLGAIPYNKLPQYYASADLVAAPSIIAADGDCEGLPTVVLEAMASGTPLVTTAVGGIPHVIENGVTGRLVAERDATALAMALAELIKDPEERKQLATRAIKRVQNLSWEHIADRHHQILKSSMRERP